MKKKLTAIIAIVLAFVLVVGLAVGYVCYQKYSEGTEKADLYSYFELAEADSNEGAIMLDGSILEQETCRILNGVCYLNIETVQEYLHNRFYYTELSREIRYTDAVSLVTAALDQSSWTVTSAGETTQQEASYMIALTLDDVCYVALDFVEKYVPVTHEIFAEPNRVVITSMEGCREMSTIKKDSAVRWRAGVKSDILTYAAKDDSVMILDAQQVEGWTKVATKDGFVGYIKNNKIKEKQMVDSVSTLDYVQPEYTSIQLDEKVRLGFHAVYNQDANATLNDVLETAYNINVISPTWFYLNDNEGGFVNIASKSYVQTAHEKGIQVWGLVEDISYDVDLYEILANSQHRTNLVEGLIAAAKEVELDGLNIDLEHVRQKQGKHFVQFLRELSIRCREEGLVLSVDNYPPNQGNTYYDYKEQGIITDYVILMNYDEHWGGSGEPGSTSSQPFAEASMDNLLEMVDASKIINALPFYTRLWTTSETGAVTDKAIFMKAIPTAIEQWKMNVSDDVQSGQKYASSSVDNKLYQMWIEDMDSLENKLKAVSERNLAGVAAWRLGYEEKAAWELIGSYIQ